MGVTNKQIEKALRATGGFISQAAVKLGISQSAVSNRLARNKDLQAIRREIEESYLDLAESKLIKKINNDDNGSIFFYLKCKGKKRGYVERQEWTGKEGGPIETESKQVVEIGPGVQGALECLKQAVTSGEDTSTKGDNKA